MEKDYSFDNLDVFPYIYDTYLENLVSQFSETLKITSYFLAFFLKKPFILKLQKEEYTNNGFNLEFSVSSSKQELTLILEDNYVKIRHENQEFVLKLSFDVPKSYIQLIEYSIIASEKKITQSIYSHQIKIEITLKDKILTMLVPYDTSCYLDYRLFNTINDDDINSLKKIYSSYFYPKQSALERQLATILTTSKIVDEEFVLLDSLTIIDGFVQQYRFSSYNDGVLISLVGSSARQDIYVKNYHFNNEIDVNKEAQRLLRKSRTINLQ